MEEIIVLGSSVLGAMTALQKTYMLTPGLTDVHLLFEI